MPEVVGGSAPSYVGTGARAIADIATAADGTTWGVGEGWLFVLDRLIGQQTDVHPLGYDGQGLAFAYDGTLLTTNGNALMEVNLATGVSQLVEQFDQDFDDLASESGASTGCRLVCPAGDGGLINSNANASNDVDIDGSGNVDLSDFAQFAAQ